MEATPSSKGQATIPKAVRERLRLNPGDRFKFFFHSDGVISHVASGNDSQPCRSAYESLVFPECLGNLLSMHLC